MLSIIILTYNRALQLFRCLDELYKRETVDFEVIVIDNGSTDDTGESLKLRQFKNLKVILNTDRTNFAHARQVGVKNSCGDKIAFIDDDCVPDANWLTRIDKALDEYDAVGGLALPYRKFTYPKWWHPEMGWMIGISTPGHLDERAGRICYPQTANMGIRRDTLIKEGFQEIGGDFKDGKFIYFSGREDAELWKRLRKSGYKTFFDKNLIVYHDIPQDRLDWEYVKKRARTDGWTYYMRERNLLYLDYAVNDLIDFIPSSLSLLLLGSNKKYGNIYYKYLWLIRQIGFIQACLSDKQSKLTLPILLKKVLETASWKLHGIMKSSLRKIVSVCYHISRIGKTRTFLNKLDEPEKIKSILLIALGFLGDMVIIIPELKAIKKCLPQARLTLLCYKNGEALLKDESLADEMIVLDKYQDGAKEAWIQDSLAKINKYKYDAVLINYYHNAPASMLLKINTDFIIGYDSDTGFEKQIWYSLLDKKLHKDFSINEILNSFRLLKEIGINCEPEKYDFHFTDDERRCVNELLDMHSLRGQLILAVHTGGIGAYKKWDLDYWGRLLKLLESAVSHRIIFISGNDEKENVDKIINEFGLKALNLCGATNPRELCLFFEHCAALLTTDSGPKHLAFVMNTPTITIYPDHAIKWGAYWNDGRHIALVSPCEDLTPEESLGLPVNHSMKMLSPQKVFDSVIDLLNKNFS